MKRRLIILTIIFVLILGGLLLFYYFYIGSPSRQVLAYVNDEKITVEEFNREIAKVESPLREMLREDPLQFLEGMIIKKLLLQEAKKEVSDSSKTYKDITKSSPEEDLISNLMEKRFSTPPNVTKDEIRGFYSIFKEQMGGKSLDQVSSEIEEILRQEKQKEETRKFILGLRTAAKIQVDQVRLQKISSKPPESNTEEDFKNAIKSGKPFLVDFGANNCLPCRQMRPILKEIDKEYVGKVKVLIIDVYRYQNLAREFKIQLIPTLIFFDTQGKEIFRHIGFMDKDKIVTKLKEIGMEK